MNFNRLNAIVGMCVPEEYKQLLRQDLLLEEKMNHVKQARQVVWTFGFDDVNVGQPNPNYPACQVLDKVYDKLGKQRAELDLQKLAMRQRGW